MFMKLDSSSQNLDSLIEQYNRELMRFYQQNAPRIQPDGEPVEEPAGTRPAFCILLTQNRVFPNSYG